jgi:hypothetical protein
MKRVAAFLGRMIVPSSKGGLTLRLLVVVALVLIIGGPIAWIVSNDSARTNASKAIDRASTALEAARPAVSTGTWENDQLTSAQAALNEANASYDRGSFFNHGAYGRAKSHATDSLASSTAITKRVNERFAAAERLVEISSYRQAIDAFFRFYKSYPRTTKAQRALDQAESALFLHLKDIKGLSR